MPLTLDTVLMFPTGREYLERLVRDNQFYMACAIAGEVLGTTLAAPVPQASMPGLLNNLDAQITEATSTVERATAGIAALENLRDPVDLGSHYGGLSVRRNLLNGFRCELEGLNEARRLLQLYAESFEPQQPPNPLISAETRTALNQASEHAFDAASLAAAPVGGHTLWAIRPEDIGVQQLQAPVVSQHVSTGALRHENFGLHQTQVPVASQPNIAPELQGQPPRSDGVYREVNGVLTFIPFLQNADIRANQPTEPCDPIV